MPSIINGLFSGRSGIASHGLAIAVVGDNISNANTIGYKASRSEFEDLIAGGQTAGKVVGSGSSVSAVTNVFEQGTLEFTGRDLDLAVDGNGFFIVDNGGQKSYTRAGNFKVDASGYIVDQKGQRVQGFPANGAGALSDISVNDVSQSSVGTANVDISGNLDASAAVLPGGAAAIPPVNAPGGGDASTYTDLNNAAEFSTVVDVFDSLGASHTVTCYFFKTAVNEYTVRAYVNAEDVEAGGTAGTPRQIGSATMTFNGSGVRTNDPVLPAHDITANIPWTNGASNSTINFDFVPFTQFATGSNIQSITADGDGVGAVTSVSIDRSGQIFALLDNGQSAVIGTIGLANFANSEGLVRVGSNLLQESSESGAPIIGRPNTGTFGRIESGSIELSTVDIANEFVKLITLQKGFQANSRIIVTINQLLNEIINLA